MAAKRQERLLERQRGAGTRQIKNTGFDLLFPGQEFAAAALLVPQKSGRSRKTPQPELLPAKSGRSRKTPQPELVPQRSTRRTPGPEELSQQPSTRRTPIQPNAKKRGRPKTIPEVEEGEAKRDDGQEAAPKKRKLNIASTNSKEAKESRAAGSEVTALEVQVKDSQPTDQDEYSPPTGGAKKRKKRKSIGQQSQRKTKSQGESPLRPVRRPQKRGRKPKPRQPIEPLVTRTPEPPEYSRTSTPALQDREQSHKLPPIGAVEAEVRNGQKLEGGKEEVEVAGPKSNKRKRKPVQKEARKRAKPEVAQEPVTEAFKGAESSAEQLQPKTKAKRGPKPGIKKKNSEKAVHVQKPTEEHGTESTQMGEKAAGDVQGVAGEESDDIASITKAAESQDKPKPRRKKRKSIGQQSMRPRKKATATVTPDKPTSERAPITKTIKEPTSRRKAAGSSTSATAKPARLPVPVEEQLPNDIANASDNQDLEPEPAQPKKKRGRPRKTDAPRSPPPITKNPQTRIQNPKPTKAAASRKPPKNTIPITFYAPPSPSASDSDAMIDPLSNPPPAPSTTIKTINAVDFLAQTCHEMLSKTSAALIDKAHALPDQKAEYTQRKQTVDIYSEELENRLFQLTTTLNANTSLATQLRKATAEGRALEKEVKAIEAEREKIKLRSEEVLKANKARELEKLLSGIKSAVKKGWEMEAAAKMVEG